MKEVRVNVVQLRDILLKNREEFVKELASTKVDYLTHAKAELEAAIAKLETNPEQRVAVHINPPVDHTAEYDRIITMLEMSVEPEITLSQEDFARYAMNEFDFMQGFKALKMSYTNAQR